MLDRAFGVTSESYAVEETSIGPRPIAYGLNGGIVVDRLWL